MRETVLFIIIFMKSDIKYGFKIGVTFSYIKDMYFVNFGYYNIRYEAIMKFFFKFKIYIYIYIYIYRERERERERERKQKQ